MESGFDRGRHPRYVESAAQKGVYSLSGEKRIGNRMRVFDHEELRTRPPCQHRFHAVPACARIRPSAFCRRSGVAASRLIAA